MTPFDAYKQYLALKNHFSKEKYDYHKYAGKSRASITSFNKRKDKYWFEKLSRQKSDEEVKNFFIANFVGSDDPNSLWIGNVIRFGDTCYTDWNKRQQSLQYVFLQESEELFSENKVDEVFDCSKGHPIVLRKFLSGKISIETLVIYDKIFLFRNNFDKKLLDPIWESVSMKIKKYSPFLNIDIFKYKKVLKNTVVGG
jgi:hypothetical protein